MQRTRAGVEYEFRTVSFSKQVSRAETRTILTEEAEYGKWELARTRIGMGGTRTVTLKRRIMRVRRTA